MFCKYIVPAHPEATKVDLTFSFKSHVLRFHTYIYYPICIDFSIWNVEWIKVHLFSFPELLVGKLWFLQVMDLLLCQEQVIHLSWRLFWDSSFLSTDPVAFVLTPANLLCSIVNQEVRFVYSSEPLSSHDSNCCTSSTHLSAFKIHHSHVCKNPCGNFDDNM